MNGPSGIAAVAKRGVGMGVALALLLAAAGLAIFFADLLMVLYPPLVIALLGGILFVWLVFHSPFLGFALVVGFRVYETPLLLFPDDGQSESIVSTISAVDLMLLVFLVVLFMQVLLTKDEVKLNLLRKYGLFFLLTLLLLVLSVPGMIYATSAPVAMAHLLRLAQPLLLAWLAFVFIRTKADLCRFAYVVLPAVAIAAVWGWCDQFSSEPLLVTLGSPVRAEQILTGTARVLGPLGEPAYFSLVLVFGIALSLVIHSLSPSRLLRVLALGCLALCWSAILPTSSRGGLLSAVIVVGVYLVLADLRHKVAIMVAAGAAVAMAFIVYSLAVSGMAASRLAETGGTEDKSTEYRLGFYSQCLRMSQDSPLFGTGHAQFPKHQAQYFDRRTPRKAFLPHSVYFQILAEDGLPALFVYLAILGVSSLTPLAASLSARTTAGRNVPALFLGLVLAMAFFATNTNLRENNFLWLSLALALVAARVCEDTPEEPELARARLGSLRHASPYPP